MMNDTGSVRHDSRAARYEYVVDGTVVGVADYQTTDGAVVMHHTFTDPAHRGHGIAAQLVAGALDDVRSRGLRVVPTCWYVAEFIESHPRYSDLLADLPPRTS
jgi:predicted GNAT family acetyltransferase